MFILVRTVPVLVHQRSGILDLHLIDYTGTVPMQCIIIEYVTAFEYPVGMYSSVPSTASQIPNPSLNY